MQDPTLSAPPLSNPIMDDLNPGSHPVARRLTMTITSTGLGAPFGTVNSTSFFSNCSSTSEETLWPAMLPDMILEG